MNVWLRRAVPGLRFTALVAVAGVLATVVAVAAVGMVSGAAASAGSASDRTVGIVRGDDVRAVGPTPGVRLLGSRVGRLRLSVDRDEAVVSVSASAPVSASVSGECAWWRAFRDLRRYGVGGVRPAGPTVVVRAC